MKINMSKFSILSDTSKLWLYHSKPQSDLWGEYSFTPLTLFAWLRARVRPSVVHLFHWQLEQSICSYPSSSAFSTFPAFICLSLPLVEPSLISFPRQQSGLSTYPYLSPFALLILPSFAGLSLPHVEPSLVLSYTIACLPCLVTASGSIRSIHVHQRCQNDLKLWTEGLSTIERV